MTTLSSMDELNAATIKNCRIEGFGSATKQILSCPFCAAPDWMRLPIMGDMDTVMEKGAKCSQCQRSAKVLTRRGPGSIRIGFVQTGGPDQPEWFEPKMPRQNE